MGRMKHLLASLRAAALSLPLLLPAAGLAQGGGRALGGVDAVSLRDSGRPVAGNPSIVTEWRGSTWLFASEANRSAFEANPQVYAPALRGLCPVALSQGQRLAGDPKLAIVIQGKIYLPHDMAARTQLENDPGIAAAAAAQLRRLGR